MSMNFQLTRVEAPTMREALQKVRATLGNDAMIVSTRTFRRGGILGVGGQEVVEVYAADTRSRIESIKENIKRETSSRCRGVEASSMAEGEPPGDLTAPSPVDSSPVLPPSRAASEPPGSFSEALVQIRQEIHEILAKAQDHPKYSHPFLRECYEILASREVDPRIAEYIVEEISRLRLPGGYPEPSRVRAMVSSQLSKLFLPNPPFDERRRPRIVVLIGPTGVGKTTTIAKLAAKAKINERRRVGLITIDTFRIAAVDQLEKYAHIIGLPLLVARTPAELEAAVADLQTRQMDLVFVDSAGRSHRDELKMAELRQFLSVLPDSEVHLVVSTATHGATNLNIANRFATAGFNRIILTKVDETISFGPLAGALISIGRPVSFVTDGQNVPDDIVASDPERLAELVLKMNAS